MSTHVERPTLLGQRSGMTFCELIVVMGSPDPPWISPEELRRRIHTFGRKATEAETCPKCYAAARPKKKQGARLPKGPMRRRNI